MQNPVPDTDAAGTARRSQMEIQFWHIYSIRLQTSALRFLLAKVLKRRHWRDDLPLPRLLRWQIPLVLSPEEVARMIDGTTNLRHRTILMTL